MGNSCTVALNILIPFIIHRHLLHNDQTIHSATIIISNDLYHGRFMVVDVAGYEKGTLEKMQVRENVEMHAD